MTEYVDNNLGSVATSPGGSWDPDANYPQFKQVTHNHDTWTSKKNGNKGHEPQDNSEWWFRNSDGGKHAWDEGEAAKAKGQFAQEQGLRAKNSALITGDSFTEEEKAEMLDRISSPHIIGSSLVFPAKGDARIEGSTLILTK